VSCVPTRRWLLRTRAVCHRLEGKDFLELLFADLHQPRRRWNSSGAGGSIQIVKDNSMATLKVGITAEDHVQGDERAQAVLVEYGDYECPHCGHAHPIVKRVQKHFGRRLAFVFRNFPLNEIHPNAESAAEAAEFAAAR